MENKETTTELVNTISVIRDIIDKVLIDTDYIESFNRLTFYKLEQIDKAKNDKLSIYDVKRDIKDYMSLQNKSMELLDNINESLKTTDNLLVALGGNNNG